MRGEWARSRQYHVTAGLAVLALLLQVILAAPLAARMMGGHAAASAAVCDSNHSARGRGATGPALPDGQTAPHACPICFAATACPPVLLTGAGLPAPRVRLARPAGPAWAVAVPPAACPSTYQPRAPPVSA